MRLVVSHAASIIGAVIAKISENLLSKQKKAELRHTSTTYTAYFKDEKLISIQFCYQLSFWRKTNSEFTKKKSRISLIDYEQLFKSVKSIRSSLVTKRANTSFSKLTPFFFPQTTFSN